MYNYNIIENGGFIAGFKHMEDAASFLINNELFNLLDLNISVLSERYTAINFLKIVFCSNNEVNTLLDNIKNVEDIEKNYYNLKEMNDYL